MNAYIFRLYQANVIGLLLVFAFMPTQTKAQDTMLMGRVFDGNHPDKDEPIVGAAVFWKGTTLGTTTNEIGKFHFPRSKDSDVLIISFPGFRSDTLKVKPKDNHIHIYLKPSMSNVVEVTERAIGVIKDPLAVGNVELIKEKELLKAACCNLAESFETTAAVEVSFSDGISGARQIQMMGLAGPYAQITAENIPVSRGVASSIGMSLVPGPWISSIQIAKGMGSVANGFESISGQINVEMKKSDDGELFYGNLFINQMLRQEANFNFRKQLNTKWSYAILTHAELWPQRIDMNQDGIADMPTGTQVNLLNRWKYDGEEWKSTFGVKVLQDDRLGGSMDFRAGDEFRNTQNKLGLQLRQERLEFFAKLGKVFPNKPYKSFGFITNAYLHNNFSSIGLKEYAGTQRSAYSNFIYQSIISDTRHTFRTGLSLQTDVIGENLDSLRLWREEWVPGAFYEYTFQPVEEFSIVAGLRGDYHNLFGGFLTPRLHLRYKPMESTTFRAMFGTGRRTSTPIAENQAALASGRRVILQTNLQERNNGFGMEEAISFGGSVTHDFDLFDRPASLLLNYYGTRFQNQIIGDLDVSAQRIILGNLNGESFSNSYQAELDFQFTRRLDAKLAYRYYDIRTTLNQQLLSKPFVAPHRGFFNISYESRTGWKFDATIQVFGTKRLPFSGDNPERLRWEDTSPAYMTINSQVAKTFSKEWEIYLGVENIGDFRQERLIIAPESPLSQNFDASIIWGPILGRMVYGGIRYKIFK